MTCPNWPSWDLKVTLALEFLLLTTMWLSEFSLVVSHLDNWDSLLSSSYLWAFPSCLLLSMSPPNRSLTTSFPTLTTFCRWWNPVACCMIGPRLGFCTHTPTLIVLEMHLFICQSLLGTQMSLRHMGCALIPFAWNTSQALSEMSPAPETLSWSPEAEVGVSPTRLFIHSTNHHT